MARCRRGSKLCRHRALPACRWPRKHDDLRKIPALEHGECAESISTCRHALMSTTHPCALMLVGWLGALPSRRSPDSEPRVLQLYCADSTQFARPCDSPCALRQRCLASCLLSLLRNRCVNVHQFEDLAKKKHQPGIEPARSCKNTHPAFMSLSLSTSSVPSASYRRNSLTKNCTSKLANLSLS